ncbi:5'-cyclic phosphodiesterase alpha,cGMP-specific 3' [Trichinella spiralis]|uniref:5'-cyclic phosphodiesterase alpha,cGMP-specific 3 n=1 Tax=Trichinella spiralis TaxID=6334 RepID=A0ABR3KHG4_TRISP
MEKNVVKKTTTTTERAYYTKYIPTSSGIQRTVEQKYDSSLVNIDQRGTNQRLRTRRRLVVGGDEVKRRTGMARTVGGLRESK